MKKSQIILVSLLLFSLVHCGTISLRSTNDVAEGLCSKIACTPLNGTDVKMELLEFCFKEGGGPEFCSSYFNDVQFPTATVPSNTIITNASITLYCVDVNGVPSNCPTDMVSINLYQSSSPSVSWNENNVDSCAQPHGCHIPLLPVSGSLLATASYGLNSIVFFSGPLTTLLQNQITGTQNSTLVFKDATGAPHKGAFIGTRNNVHYPLTSPLTTLST